MIGSLSPYDPAWNDLSLLRKGHAAGDKLFDAPSVPDPERQAAPAVQTVVQEPLRVDSGIGTAIWSAAVSEPTSREVEPRGVSYKDDGLMLILSNDDDTQNGICTVNPKDDAESQIVYVETDDRGTKRGYEVDVSKVDLRHCTRIEALAVASLIKDEIAARSDGTTSAGVGYRKGLIGDFYDMACDVGAMFASKSDMVWDETIDFIKIAERHLAHWNEPLEGSPKPKIADGDAVTQCIRIADELSRAIDEQEKLPPERRNVHYEGWDEIDVTKLGSPEGYESSAASLRSSASSVRIFDLADLAQRAVRRANDAWQDFFKTQDEDDKRS